MNIIYKHPCPAQDCWFVFGSQNWLILFIRDLWSILFITQNMFFFIFIEHSSRLVCGQIMIIDSIFGL